MGKHLLTILAVPAAALPPNRRAPGGEGGIGRGWTAPTIGKVTARRMATPRRSSVAAGRDAAATGASKRTPRAAPPGRGLFGRGGR